MMKNLFSFVIYTSTEKEEGLSSLYFHTCRNYGTEFYRNVLSPMDIGEEETGDVTRVSFNIGKSLCFLK